MTDRTEHKDVHTQWVNIPVLGGDMGVYAARPRSKGAALPVRRDIVVLQEIFGVNPHIRDVTERFAAQGYLAVAPDLFHRGGARFESGYEDFQPGRERRMKTPDTDFLADMDCVLKWLWQQGAERIGVVGFCYGGRQAFLSACTKRIDAAVGFYGARIPEGPLALSRWISAPVLLHFGERDSSIPLDEVRDIETGLAASGRKDAEIIVYPGAPHGFFCDQRKDYTPEAARLAWKRTLEFFRKHLMV